jgi:arylsulfatase A-like enzyme
MRRLLVLVALAVLAASCRLPIQRGRWNVLVVVVDTLRADRLGAYGYRRPTSPSFDALAAESFLFTDARAQSACTFPSVNSLLTSRYPSRFLGQPAGAMGIPAGTPSVAEILRAGGWSTAAVSASAVVREHPSRHNPSGGFGRGFDRFDEDCLWRDASCVTRRGLESVARLREPFFLYLHYLDPHGPYDPPQPFRKRFRVGRTTQPWALRGNPSPLARMLDGTGGEVAYRPPDVRFLQGLYDGEIAFFDSQLGALLEELRERRLLGRTIVVVVADHGESFLEHGTVKHCRSVFDSEVKTPFLVRLPRQRAGARLAGAVQNVDLVPTLLDLLGLPLAGRGFEGRSLVARLEGAPPTDELAFAAMGAQRSVADGRYKLIADLGSGSWRLFDLRADPGELRDVAARAPEPLARLRRALRGWVSEVEGEKGLLESEEAQRRLRALGYL